MNQKPDEYFEIIDGLHRLRATPPRDPAAATAGRKRFLAKARSMQPPANVPTRRAAPGRGWRWTLGRAVAALLLALVATGTGVGFAAQAALPSDGLFAAKLGIERLRLALTPNQVATARLQLQFLQTRAEEIQALAEQGRTDAIAAAASLYRESLLRASELVLDYQERGEPNGEDLLAQLTALLVEQQAFFTELFQQYPELADTDLGLLFGLVDGLNEAESLDAQGATNAALLSFSPSQIGQGRTIAVTIRGEGTHFTDESLVYFEPASGLTVRTVHAFNEQELFVRIEVAPDAPVGEVSVWVQSDGEIARGVSLAVVEGGEEEIENDEDRASGELELEEHQEDPAEAEHEEAPEIEDENGEEQEIEEENVEESENSGPGGQDDEHEEEEQQSDEHEEEDD